MTFSDSRVVQFINENFVPVWESASAARWVKFELGEGRSVEGIATGEVALYFCDAEGHVFDILPALQSPAQTLEAMKAAAKTFEEAEGNFSDQSLLELHKARMKEIAKREISKNDITRHFEPLGSFVDPQEMNDLQKSEEGIKTREERINESVDAATKDLRHLAFSKALVAMPSSSALIVVEPGGKDYYRWEVARRFCEVGVWQTEIAATTWESLHKKSQKGEPISTRTPYFWMEELFTFVLQQPLDRGGEFTYDSSSLEAIRIVPK